MAAGSVRVSPADYRRCHHRRRLANSQPRYYAPEPGYVVYGGYGEPYPVACPGGYWARRPIAFDAYGNPIRWSRARFICP